MCFLHFNYLTYQIFSVAENKLNCKRKDKWVEVVTTPAEVREILKFYQITSGRHVGIVNTKNRIIVK